MNKLLLTSSQTVGPFFAPALLCKDAVRNVLVQPETLDERVRIEGHVLRNASGCSPRSHHAVVPFAFQFQVRWVTQEPPFKFFPPTGEIQ